MILSAKSRGSFEDNAPTFLLEIIDVNPPMSLQTTGIPTEK